MTFRFSMRSLDRLKGVHPHLVEIMHEAIKTTHIDFTVLEGLRSTDRQRKLVKSGASKTMNSRHLTGHAVDIALWVKHTTSAIPNFSQSMAPLEFAPLTTVKQ